MSDAVSESVRPEYVGNDKALFGIVFGVLAFWLFAQTTLNIAPLMGEELGVQTTVMNIAVSITALFSGASSASSVEASSSAAPTTSSSVRRASSPWR